MSSGPRSDGLIVHIEMPVAVVRSKPIRSFDRLRANGCDSQAGHWNRTVTHLLRAGVDLNAIRSWLGHVSLDTTQVYAEIDLEMKARALEKCSTTDVKKPTVASDGALMAFLRAI
jgi:integrase